MVLNTIHCGEQSDGVEGQWQAGATAGGGRFFNIDQNRAVAQIPCPQDPRLLELNEALNDTYLWFGAAEDRAERAENQARQDGNAGLYGSSNLSKRAAAKASGAYGNVGRDLIDSYGLTAESPEELAAELAEIPQEELPEQMQPMTPQERVAHVQKLTERRKAIVAEINELSAARAAFLAEQVGEGDDSTLGKAMSDAVRQQLRDAGYDVK